MLRAHRVRGVGGVHVDDYRVGNERAPPDRLPALAIRGNLAEGLPVRSAPTSAGSLWPRWRWRCWLQLMRQVL